METFEQAVHITPSYKKENCDGVKICFWVHVHEAAVKAECMHRIDHAYMQAWGYNSSYMYASKIRQTMLIIIVVLTRKHTRQSSRCMGRSHHCRAALDRGRALGSAQGQGSRVLCEGSLHSGVYTEPLVVWGGMILSELSWLQNTSTVYILCCHTHFNYFKHRWCV